MQNRLAKPELDAPAKGGDLANIDNIGLDLQQGIKHLAGFDYACLS